MDEESQTNVAALIPPGKSLANDAQCKDQIVSCNDQLARKYFGVRKSTIPKPLPNEVAIERNFIRAPTCVAHASSAEKTEFVYLFKKKEENGEIYVPTLRLKSDRDELLPLPQHAKVLDVLLALFANNFNDDGEVWFSYADIARPLGINPRETSSIKEAIKRYYNLTMHFEKSWVDQPGRFTSEAMRPISRTDLFDKDKDHNPRNSRLPKDLHYIKFSPAIIQSVQTKQIRLFPRDAFSELDAWSYMLYKIFYAPTDKEPVRRTVTFIGNFVGWSSGMPRLRVWIVKHLEVLQEKKFILWWQVKDDCYEVQANPAKYRKDDGFLTAKDPLLAEAAYAGRIIQTKKRGQLTGEKAANQTKAAVVSATASPILKKNRPAKAPEGQSLDAAANILGQIASMSQEQLGVLAAFLRAVPEKERDSLLMQRMVLAASMS